MSLDEIVAAINSNDAGRAENLARRRLDDMPGNEDLLFLLAISLQLQARASEAVDVYARLTSLAPANGSYWANYGTVLTEAGFGDEAESAFNKAIGIDPNDPFPRVQLGLLLVARKNYVSARETLLDAFDLDKASPLARIHAARACCLCQDFNGAEDLLRPWRQWLPLNDDALQLELSRLLVLMSNADAAALLLEDLAARNSANHEALLMLAGLYERMNKLVEAEAIVDAIERSSAALNPSIRNELAHASAKLALRKGDPAAASDLLERAGPLHEGDYAYYYELAQARDKLGAYPAALDALGTAHELQVKDLIIASPEHFAEDARPLPAAVPRVSLERYRAWPEVKAPDAASSPVFIVGFPRSGTTLLEQMLDAHPALQSMDENPFFNKLADKLWNDDRSKLRPIDSLQQRDCDELRKAYLVMASAKVARRWDAQLVDKNPLNLLWVPMIHRLFPDAKYILAIRHPCDVILSCYMQNFRSSVLASASSNLPRLAAAYVQAMETWLEDVSIFKPDVMVSRYEDLVADAAGQTRRLATFLGLEDATPMMAFDRHARDKGYIATPSYSQVIKPINRKGVDRWRNYEEAFAPLLPVLESMLRHWGYA